LGTYSSMLTVTTAPDLSSQVRESLWEAGQEDKSSTLAGTSKEGVLRQQVGGTVWQTAVGVGGVCTGCCCCRNLCKCRAALLLLLRLFGTQVSSSSSSEQVRRWVGSPEPGHGAKHRPKWRLLHLHLQLGSLQVLAHNHLSSSGKYNLLARKSQHGGSGKKLRL